MKTNFYSIYDKKAKVYNIPFSAMNDECAIRLVVGSLDRSSMLKIFPYDYVLECIGSFDDETGNLLPKLKKEIVAELSNLVPSDNTGDGDYDGDGQTSQDN